MATFSPVNGWRDATTESRYKMVERIILKMREHLDEPFPLQQMAEISNLSPFHFNRIFRQITGIPPTQFLYALRLEAAKRLLLTTHLRVTDVCYEVGYNSLGTFSTRFTQLVGLTPYQLRHLTELQTTLPLASSRESREPFPALANAAACVEGQISSPQPRTNAVFVGLFRTRIPQGRPVAGALLTELGRYRIGPLPDGRYYLLAAALPDATEPLTYLLPNTAAMLVGSGQGALIVKGGQVFGNANIKLRPMRLTDPPILTALTSLLTRQLDETSFGG